MPLTMAENRQGKCDKPRKWKRGDKAFSRKSWFCGRNGSYCIIRDGRKRDREY